jgi:hypothetical protein
MTVQKKTRVRIKERPKVEGYVYGSLQDRRNAGLDYVMVYSPLPDGGMEGRSQYKLDELEEIGPWLA